MALFSVSGLACLPRCLYDRQFPRRGSELNRETAAVGGVGESPAQTVAVDAGANGTGGAPAERDVGGSPDGTVAVDAGANGTGGAPAEHDAEGPATPERAPVTPTTVHSARYPTADTPLQKRWNLLAGLAGLSTTTPRIAGEGPLWFRSPSTVPSGEERAGLLGHRAASLVRGANSQCVDAGGRLQNIPTEADVGISGFAGPVDGAAGPGTGASGAESVPRSTEGPESFFSVD